MSQYPAQTNQLLDLLGISLPIIQAPMAGVSNRILASAVAGTGALGSLGLGGGSPEVLDGLRSKLSSVSRPPINLNFFVHGSPNTDPEREAAWLNRLTPHFERLGAAPPASISAPYPSFDDNPATLDALLALEPSVVSFHFGLPSSSTMKALRSIGTRVLSSATNVREARALAKGGVDAIIAQGWEAGGHRGHFLNSPARPDEQLPLAKLLPQVCEAVEVPVIAAGGIGTGQAAAAALRSGAAAVQLGTAFVSAEESSANQAYRDALVQPDASTVMTRVFSGREARGLENLLTTQLDEFADEAPDYPITYDAGKALSAAAAATNKQDLLQGYSAMWAGQSLHTNRPMPAAELVQTLEREMTDALLAS